MKFIYRRNGWCAIACNQLFKFARRRQIPLPNVLRLNTRFIISSRIKTSIVIVIICLYRPIFRPRSLPGPLVAINIVECGGHIGIV